VRSFVLLALLTGAGVCAVAQELPSAPSALGEPVLQAAAVATPAPDPAAQEIAALAIRLPLRSLNDAAAGKGSFLVSPLVTPLAKGQRRKVVDRNFLLMMGVGTALTVIDFEMTQRCLSRGVCQEANPLVPTSRAGMYVTNLPLNAALYYWSYRRKASGKRLWWVAPLAIIGSHAVGVASNVPFVGKTAP
jgi:hypothetical protein